jgi:chemosensory pili system protein ChpA (sensor histidine kinase/response regulator)
MTNPASSPSNEDAFPVPEMLEAFSTEAREILDAIEAALLPWEKNEKPEDQRKAVRRHFHTLKGAANSIGLSGFGADLHYLEDGIESMPLEKAGPAFFSQLLKCVDDGRTYLNQLAANSSAPWPFHWSEEPAAEAAHIPVAEGPALDPDMIEAFLFEAGDIVTALEGELLRWEKNEDPDARKQAVRRHIHTLKGAANSVGLANLGTALHALEDLLDKTPSATPEFIGFLLQRLDTLRAYLAALGKEPARVPALDTDLFRSPSAAPAPATQAATEKAAPESQFIRVEAFRLREIMDQVSEMVIDRSRFEAKLDRLQTLRRDVRDSQSRFVQAVEALRTDAKRRSGGPDRASAMLLPRKHKGDDLALGTFGALENLLQELAADAGQIERELTQLIGSFKEDARSFNRTTHRIQDELAGLNMTPVSSLFRRLARAFRDALREENKKAELEFEGEETLADRVALDQLYGSMLHVVRNAVAHGIERPEKRAAAGKPETGTVRLVARQEGNEVVIEVRDDGNGISEEAIRRGAINRGLVPADHGPLSREEVVRFLFMPGFSTAEKVTSVAGRGVGLDVVQQEILRLGGTVDLSYEPGKGTTWSIHVPASLTATEAVLIGCGTETFALPLSFVDQAILLGNTSILEQDGKPVIQLGGEILPFLDLGKVLHLPSGEALHGVLVQGDGRRAVLGAERIVARREIVVKPLGPLVGRHSLFSGASLDPSGKLHLVLQVPTLLRWTGTAAGGKTPGSSAITEEETPQAPLHVLVVDDSLSVRRVQERALVELGCRVTLASDGVQALELLAETTFDLILSDLEMPRLDGFGLLKEARSVARLADVPFILITSRTETPFAEEATRLGATAFLPKPFSSTRLKPILERLRRRQPAPIPS